MIARLYNKILSLLDKQRDQLEADKVIYSRLLVYLKPYQNRFFMGLAASIPASSLEGLVAFFSGPLLDKLIKGGDYNFLMWVPVIIVGFSILQGVFEYISQYCTTYVGNNISIDIQTEMYDHLLGMDLGFYKANTFGELATRYSSDPQKLQQAIVSNLQGLLIQFFTMIFLAGVLVYRNWELAVIALCIISLIVVPLVYISQKIRHLDHITREAQAEVSSLYQETIYGVREVKSFSLYSHMRRRFNWCRQKLYDTTMATNKKNILLSPIMQLIASFGIGAIVYLGTLYVQGGRMTPGDLASFLLALLLLYKPVKVVGSTLGKISVILAPAERVFRVMDLVAGIQSPANPVEIGTVESLEYRGVEFSYQRGGENKPVLRDINLTIQAGDMIGIVGTSGGGKSTLIDMISRFIDPSEGQVLVNGTDLRQVDINELRSKVAMVSQETMTFGGTIRENILMGNLNASTEELEGALRVAHLSDWVKSLPEGLDTPVGDRGSLLSGGQRQRVAIARAYLKNAPILILDEATSALDNESEAIVQDALLGLMQGRTVITVAHRLSTIRHANRILVIEDGLIIESGTHEELVAHKGVYHKLYSLQFRDQDAVTAS